MNNCRGFSVLEVIVTTSIMAILMGMAVSNLRLTEQTAIDSADELMSFVKSVRSKAIATTSAYRVYAVDASNVFTQYGTDCDNATTYNDSLYKLTLPDGGKMFNTTWSVCFSPRGIADATATIPVRDNKGTYRTVEILLGGAVRIIHG